MKILVCISNVPDTTTKIKFTDNNTRFDSTGVQWVINPWDELALTRALELRDDTSNSVNKVTVGHVGTSAADPTIRKALAIGADDAIRINAEPEDAYQVAAQLAEVIKKEQFDIIFAGIESSDFNGSTVGSMIAEFLDYPSVSAVSGLNIDNDEPVITREIDGGKETVTIPTPCIAVVQKGIAIEPKIASMRGIMQARTKSIKVMEPVDVDIITEVVTFEPPQPKPDCVFIEEDNPGKLVELLQNEAKVI